MLYGHTVSHMGGEMTTEQKALEHASRAAEVTRYEWHGAFGLVVVEVRQGHVYVNGDWVEPVDAQEPRTG